MNELKLDPRRTAIVVIDIQKGIVAMAAGAPHATASVVANCVNLLTSGRRAGTHAVLVHVGGSPNGADLLRPVADDPMRGTAALPPDWSDLLPELGSSPSDTVILKRQWGDRTNRLQRKVCGETADLQLFDFFACSTSRVWATGTRTVRPTTGRTHAHLRSAFSR
jgi:hypothetical protein